MSGLSSINVLALCLSLYFGLPKAHANEPETEASEQSTPSALVSATLSAEVIRKQERCLALMSGLSDNSAASRYQFLVLAETVGQNVGERSLAALDFFGQPSLPDSTPMIAVIEGIANPITMQAMPSLTVAQTAALTKFAINCDRYIRGQIDSLASIQPELNDPTFNQTIREDGLYLRQMTGEALARLMAAEHPEHGSAVENYGIALLQLRDEIEFVGFESDLEDLEALYLEDLDQKLALVNDQINGEMDVAILDSSIEISRDLSEAAEYERHRRMTQTLLQIMRTN